MTSDFAGFNFLQAAMSPVSDIRRGYGLGGTAAPDIRRGYGLGDVAAPDIRRGYGLGGVAAPDTTQHSTSTYMALPQS
ncbi:MAG: hypothetical protein ACRYG8_46305 [Janthinobacterium lividum]